MTTPVQRRATSEPALLGGPVTFPDRLGLCRPVFPDIPAITRRLGEVLASGQLTNGRNVAELEVRVATRCAVKHAIAVSSCTSGLMLVYRALAIQGPVVIPSMTFAASAHAVAWAGGTPRWCDVEPQRLTADPRSVRTLVTGAAAVSATHIYGNPCDVESLETVAREHDLPLVLDAAHALGARRDGRPVGGFGTAEVFSLSPTKVVPAGEGGVVTTNNDALAAAIRIGRDYANPGDYDTRFVGLNARMSELHAVVALASLAELDERLDRRVSLVDRFRTQLSCVPGLRVVTVDHGDSSTYKDMTVVVDPPSFGLTVPQLRAALDAEGVDSRRYFHPPCDRQQAYAHLPPAHLPVTERLAPAVLSLPLHSLTTINEIDRLADLLGRLAGSASRVRLALGGSTREGTSARA